MSAFSSVEAECEKLIRLLQEEKELIGSYYDLTLEQSKAIEDENTAVLKRSLNKRDQIIESVEELRRGISALMQFCLSNLAEESLKSEIQSLEDDIQAKLREIQKTDQENAEKIKEQMQNYGMELKRTSESSKGIGLYNQKDAIQGASLFDKMQ